MSADFTLLALDDDRLEAYRELQRADMTGDIGDRPESENYSVRQISEGMYEETVTDKNGGKHTFTVMTSDRWSELASRLDYFGGEGACWVSEVSWMKAGLLEDYGRYVPGPIQGIVALLDSENPPVITDALITQIMVAMNKPNRSIYTHTYRYMWVPEYRTCSTKYKDRGQRGVERRQRVKRWLEAHKGMRLGSESL